MSYLIMVQVRYKIDGAWQDWRCVQAGFANFADAEKLITKRVVKLQRFFEKVPGPHSEREYRAAGYRLDAVTSIEHVTP